MTAHTAAAAKHVDIAADRVAKVYAQAIVDAADAAGCRREVLAELATIAREVLPRVPAAEAVFASPKIPAEEKARLIDTMAKGRLQATSINALHVLGRHGRLGMLGPVVDAAERLAEERDGMQRATFTTATPLDAAERARIAADVEKALAVRLKPEFVVDPGIIGGLVVRIGDTIYDQSVATGLERLGDRIHQRNVHAIQNGEYSWHN